MCFWDVFLTTSSTHVAELRYREAGGKHSIGEKWQFDVSKIYVQKYLDRVLESYWIGQG